MSEPDDHEPSHWLRYRYSDTGMLAVFDAGDVLFASIEPSAHAPAVWSLSVASVLTEAEAHALLRVAMGALGRLRGLPEGERFAALDPFLDEPG